MLKRQRPVTPPPSSLGDPPSSFSNGPIRPLQSLYTTDPSQPRFKRQRTQPPPLDGTLRGTASSHWESDGEEDWVEDPHTVNQQPLPPSMTASQYKDANSLLHELHVLSQHRLLFTQPSRERYLNPSAQALPRRPLVWTGGPPYYPGVKRNGLADQCYCIEPTEGKGPVEEVQCVRQHYEDANRFLGSLFLSRRRQVGGVTSATDLIPSS